MSERQNGLELVSAAITEYYGERCPDDEPGCPCCDAWAWLDAAVAERAAHQAALAQRVEVKPLVWFEVETHFGTVWDSSPTFAYPYRITFRAYGSTGFCINALDGVFDTLDAAKAAAQADYEARIRSAIK